MMEYARAFAAAVECELSNGDVPFDDHELVDRLTTRVTTLPKRNVRVIGLHVWHKGAISSRSMLAVQASSTNSPTVPAMKAVQPRGVSASADDAHARATVRPQIEAAASAAPAARPRMPSARVSAPAARPRPESRVSGAQRAAEPRPPAVSGMAPITASALSQAAMISGVVPAVEPRIVRSKSGFLIALEQCPAGSGGKLGQALAQPLRNAAALVLLGALEASHDQLSDPLRLLEAHEDDLLRRKLIGEACVCVSYLLYECLAQTEVPQMQCIEVVQGACTAALRDDSMPVSEISRYLATESPREELTGRLCGLLGIRETPELQRRVETSLRSVRIDVRSSAEEIESKLTSSGKAESVRSPEGTGDASQRVG
jgi:hypothetical protein